MTQQTLIQALNLDAGEDGALIADLTPDFSNAARAYDPMRGGPFGGLMAALAARATRQALDIEAPLQTLTVQYLAAARFEPIAFHARLLRGGRSTAFAAVEAGQPGRPALSALATFGRSSSDRPIIKPLSARTTPFGDLDEGQMDPAFAPWFTRYIEHRFDGDHGLYGRGTVDDPTLRLWMRTTDHAPLDEARLCFLLDGIFPAYMTVLPAPPVLSASVDLRYDLLEPLTPEVSPEGWAIFEFTVRDVGGGWAADDGVAFSPDGRPLALARQRRKLVSPRRDAP
jgi:acyl-coenzyme A thioesterase PaaI-like protein